MPSLNIHRNDTVKVLTGSDRGKTGRVLRVFPDKGTVLVEHVRVVKKTVSSKQGQRTKGGIAEQESPINVSNVDAGLPQLRAGARGLQDRRRQQGEGLQKVRTDDAHQGQVGRQADPSRAGNCAPAANPFRNGRRIASSGPPRAPEEREQRKWRQD